MISVLGLDGGVAALGSCGDLPSGGAGLKGNSLKFQRVRRLVKIFSLPAAFSFSSAVGGWEGFSE